MTGLEKAKKKFWYDSNFDKQDNHLDHYLDLLTFAQGYKAALEWVLGINSIYSDCNGECFTLQDIRKELNGTS